MTFLGWLLMGGGLLLLYGAARNLSVTCIVRNVIQGKSASCAKT